MCKSMKGNGLYVTCLQEKWTKGKEKVKTWFNLVVEQGNTELDYKDLEQDVGFLVHLSRTFPMTIRYFKGIYNSMDAWGSSRDQDSWKLSCSEMKELLGMEMD